MNASQYAYRNGYLKSEHWENLRLRALANTKGVEKKAMCFVCGHQSLSNDVHHIYYPKRLRDTKVGHLAVLCRPCHDKVHAIIDDQDKLRSHRYRQVQFRVAVKKLRRELGLVKIGRKILKAFCQLDEKPAPKPPRIPILKCLVCKEVKPFAITYYREQYMTLCEDCMSAVNGLLGHDWPCGDVQAKVVHRACRHLTWRIKLTGGVLPISTTLLVKPYGLGVKGLVSPSTINCMV